MKYFFCFFLVCICLIKSTAWAVPWCLDVAGNLCSSTNETNCESICSVTSPGSIATTVGSYQSYDYMCPTGYVVATHRIVSGTKPFAPVTPPSYNELVRLLNQNYTCTLSPIPITSYVDPPAPALRSYTTQGLYVGSVRPQRRFQCCPGGTICRWWGCLGVNWNSGFYYPPETYSCPPTANSCDGATGQYEVVGYESICTAPNISYYQPMELICTYPAKWNPGTVTRRYCVGEVASETPGTTPNTTVSTKPDSTQICLPALTPMRRGPVFTTPSF